MLAELEFSSPWNGPAPLAASGDDVDLVSNRGGLDGEPARGSGPDRRPGMGVGAGNGRRVGMERVES